MIHKTEHFLSKNLKEEENMSIGEEQVECPLCMEPLELDDINFYPCTCGYQICRFCWNRIRTDENGLCPACRKSYPEDPAAFKPLTDDELQRIKRERKMKDLQRKQKAAENRKHLANVRVVQKNLVFAVGLSQRLGDTEVLKKHDYFGKFGKIVKVVINQSTSYAGSQGPSASAYITYHKAEDALRAIQVVNNIHVDGRTIKASLGTTKYCSHFLRGTQCPKPDCMYLHELGDEAASFTKEEMQQGKHQEYEQKLYEQYMNQLNMINATNHTTATTTSQSQPHSKNNTNHTSRKKTHSPGSTQRQTPPQSATSQQNNHTHPPHTHNSDAWPSLHTGGGQPPNRPSTERTTTNSNHKGPSPPITNTHTNSSSHQLSQSLGSVATSASSSSTTGTTHKRNLSSDLHNRGGGGGTVTVSQRQTLTPDPNTAVRVQHSESNSTSQQAHNPHHQSEPPIQPAGSVVTNCTAPSSQQQLSPAPVHSPLTQPPPNKHHHTHNSTHTQPIVPQRKSLYGDSHTESLSLFSNSGFPVNRVKHHHPGLHHHTTNAQQPPAAPTEHTTNTKLNHHNGGGGGPEIPDTISVSSSTDWQAAFGFQPAMISSRVMMGGGHVGQQSVSRVPQAEQQINHNSLPDNNADDDLGFDPWNESTKALQDLIEKEAVTAATSGHQPMTQQQQSIQHPPHHFHTQQQQQQALLGLEQTKPVPPGFSQNSLGAFTQNPMLGGSRMMMGLGGKFPHHSQASQPGFPHSGLEALASDLALCGSVGPAGLPGGPPDSFNMKSWQEGLRALLPNINIHFGTPQDGTVPMMAPSAAGAAAPGLTQHQHMIQSGQKNIQQTAPQKYPQNNWDLSDPAIVTSGNVADGPEEPHWMASLHHLTEDTTPNSTPQQLPARNPVLPPYSNTASRFPYLGGGGAGHRHHPSTHAGQFAPQSAAATAPPPGFQNSIRPPTHVAAAGGMLDSHKQLMDAFQ